MNDTPQWLGRLGVHQDLVWFLVLIGWSLATALWWRVPTHRSEWHWVPWVAAIGILTTLVQFFSFNPPFEIFQELLIPGTHEIYVPALIAPDLLADIVLASGTFAILALWWLRMAPGGESKWFRGAMILTCIASGPLQVTAPWPGALLYVALPWIAMIWLGLRRPVPPLACVCLILAALLPLISPVGPVAILAGKAQRAGATGWFGAICALAHLLVVSVIMMGLIRNKLRGLKSTARRTLMDDLRPFWYGGIAWLGLGVAAALLAGSDNVKEIKVNRMRLTASRAQDIPATLVDRLKPPMSTADQVATRSILENLSTSLPFLKGARFVVRQDNGLVAYAVHGGKLTSSSLGPLDAVSARDWAEARPEILSGKVPEAWTPYYTRVPLRDSQGHMAGWLEFAWVEFYMTLARKWRTGPLLVTALGTVLAAVFFVQRRNSREREEALRVAAVAAEAGRIKTSFLAKVSHELRTPLQSILGYGELLEQEVSTPASRKQLAALRQHGQLMTRLVNDLIDLSALESGAFRLVENPVSLTNLIRQTVDSLRPRGAAKGLAINLRIAPDTPEWILGDAERLRQILINLVNNALKYTQIGHIDIALAHHTDDQAQAIELTVTDTGPGIARDEQDRLFQPFSRLELTAAHEGSGLGLALVAGLCRSMGGRVWVESELGKGACFRVKLPIKSTTAPQAEAASQTGTLLHGLRVLIADDNALVRELFTAYLNEQGAGCSIATNGEEALQLARKQNFDAIILDLAMPGINGGEVARRLRAEGSSVHIVGVSAHTDPADRAEALAAGMNTFLTKPVELSALGRSVLPGSTAMPVETRLAELRKKLVRQFRQELPGEVERLSTALAKQDWATLGDAIHHMKNSALVVDDARLGKACSKLESAITAGDHATVESAWTACMAAFQPWLKSNQML